MSLTQQPQPQAVEVEPNLFEQVILRLFKRLSVCILVLGRRGSGKTDIALYIAEILNKFGILENFGTNIKIHSSDFPIDYITNLEDLESWCKNRVGRKLFIIDEAGKTLRRRTPMSALNIALLDNLQILRKYKLSIILITPAFKYIDSATLGSDILDVIIEKPNSQNPKIALYDDVLSLSEELRFTNLPRTSVAFDTWDVAPFQKQSPKKSPMFKDEQIQKLYEWSQGISHKELGLHPMEINRLARKFVKETLEASAHGSQS